MKVLHALLAVVVAGLVIFGAGLSVSLAMNPAPVQVAGWNDFGSVSSGGQTVTVYWKDNEQTNERVYITFTRGYAASIAVAPIPKKVEGK